VSFPILSRTIRSSFEVCIGVRRVCITRILTEQGSGAEGRDKRKSSDGHPYIVDSFFMLRLIAALPLFAASLFAQQAPVFRVEADGRELSLQSNASSFRLGDHLQVTLTRLTDADGVRVKATLRNTGPAPIRLNRVTLAERTDRALADAHFLAMTGWQVASRVKRLTPGTTLVSKVVTQLFEPATGKYTHAGFLSFDRVSTLHELAWPKGGDPVFRSLCDFEGYRLPPGQSVATEELWVAPGQHLDDWASKVAQRYQPKLPDQPPSGWVGWSWVDPFNIERYEDVALRNAEAIRQRLPGLPVNYLWVSLGNLPDRRPGAWLKWNEKSFPSGRESFINKLHELKYQFGLWCGAFWMNSQLSEEVERLRPAFLRKDGKPLTVPHRDLGEMFILDPTHPLTLEYLRDVFTEYRRWGVRYYMIDFLNAIGGSIPGTFIPSSYADANVIPGPAPYRQALKVIRDAAGPDTFLLASTGPTFWGIGLFDGIRGGSDYGEGRPLDGPGKGFWPATFVINNPTYWTSHRTATDALASHAFVHRKLFWADSGNVLTVGQPVPLNDAQISTTIFGINGGQIMLGDEIGQLPAERLRLLRLVFPRFPEAARALDLFTSAEPDYPKFFHLPVRTDWDKWDLYAIFNYGAEPITKTIPAATPSIAWDFWNERYLGAVEKGLQVTVQPESVRLIRLSRRRDHPWVIGTNLHVRQGQAEIAACNWSESAHRLDITYRAYPQQEGSIFVEAPAGWSVENPKGLAIAKDGNDNRLIIAIPVREPTGSVSITFRPAARDR
jgi:hypothetical protein